MSEEAKSTNTITATTTTTNNVNAANARYTFDKEALAAFRKEAPWKDHPKWFTKVEISPTAVMKMMTHCHSGVTKGISAGGNPIEVMGLLLGRPDPTTRNTLIVTDVFPLPIEGFETRVIADDEDVVNHMIALGESLERTRHEKFMGWYHSHPFELGELSHCFLSQTDISTQLQWQRAEDPHGNPFLAIVVDPLRSLDRGIPELKAFRCYPPEYTSPTANECPDGTVMALESNRLSRWGSCWSRYYELQVDYFMSSMARGVMHSLTQKFLWIGSLGATGPEKVDAEGRVEYRKRVEGVVEKLSAVDPMELQQGQQSSSSSTVAAVGSALVGGGGSSQRNSKVDGGGETPSPDESQGEMQKACLGVVELATEKIHTNIAQTTKKQIFS